MNIDRGTRETPRRFCKWIDDVNVSETLPVRLPPMAIRRRKIVTITKKTTALVCQICNFVVPLRSET